MDIGWNLAVSLVAASKLRTSDSGWASQHEGASLKVEETAVNQNTDDTAVRFDTRYIMLTTTLAAVIMAVIVRLKIPGIVGYSIACTLLLAAAGLGRNALIQLFNTAGRLFAFAFLPATAGGLLLSLLAQMAGLSGPNLGVVTLAGAGIGFAVGMFAVFALWRKK
jgi:uncharacterized membrane protein YccC